MAALHRIVGLGGYRIVEPGLVGCIDALSPAGRMFTLTYRRLFRCYVERTAAKFLCLLRVQQTRSKRLRHRACRHHGQRERRQGTREPRCEREVTEMCKGGCGHNHTPSANTGISRQPPVGVSRSEREPSGFTGSQPPGFSRQPTVGISGSGREPSGFPAANRRDFAAGVPSPHRSTSGVIDRPLG